MNKTREFKTDQKLAVDMETLQSMLCVGKNTARQIGEAAGARVQIGRRVLYNTDKIRKYLAEVSG